ncbi:MAG: DUF4163 domain-containing protein [Deltaproteobacteria bacterium]|jgi:hypothetical protein|nr:DUF4163 domain-containing protein [Deltaproteobacteria bacterium]
MRFPPSAAPRAAAALSIALAAAVWTAELPAQWLEVEAQSFLGRADRSGAPLAVKAEALSYSKSCPKAFFRSTVVYPQGFDGGGPVDQLIKAKADEAYRVGSGQESFMEEEYEIRQDCQSLEDTYYHDVKSSPYRVSPKIVSVLFLTESYTGGAHMQFLTEVMNLFPDGRPVLVSDLFPNRARSLQLFWERIMRDSCVGHETVPTFYGGGQCGTFPPSPFQDTMGGATLDSLGGAVLTQLGLTINLDPYMAWSFGEGPFTLDIPKNDLIAMGASPEIW